MSTPTYPSKRFFAAGAKKGSTWGTAVALGAGFGILIENDGNPSLKQPYQSHEDIDAIIPFNGDLGPVGACDFSPEFSMRYDPGAIGSLIAALFGAAGTPQGMYVVSTSNDKIDFDEGGSELTATVASGTYTGTALATAIAAALNAAIGIALTYTCTYSAATNKFTIGAGSNFTIRWNTGTHKATDISTLCGYSDDADDTGADSYVSDSAGAGTAMKHVFTWADSISEFFTFAVERPGTILEVPSAMPFKLNLKVSNGILKGTISLRGNTLTFSSATNTATQMDALTYQDRGNRIKFSHGALWMNAESGDALDSGDALEHSDIEINYERDLDEVHVAGSNTIVKPYEKGSPKITVKVTLPRTSSTNLAYLATFLATTAQKMMLTFTGAIAGASVNYSLVLGFPRLKFIDPPDAPLADAMTTVLNFEAEEAASAPTGMTGYVRPYAELVNLQTTDYLA